MLWGSKKRVALHSELCRPAKKGKVNDVSDDKEEKHDKSSSDSNVAEKEKENIQAIDCH